MIALGLSVDGQARFEAALCDDHWVGVRVSVLDMEHNVTGVADGAILGGQVDVDRTQQVDRSARVELLDPDNALGLDAGNPHMAALHADRMLQVVYRVHSPGLGWVEVPVFVGPITSTARDGQVVQVSAHGKESLLLAPCNLNHTWRKGTKITDVIRGMLTVGGERKLDIPDLPQRSTVDAAVGPLDKLWDRAQGWARALGRHLFYDGRGVAQLRSPAAAPAWTFRGGDGGALLSVPQVTSDITQVRNLVVVAGADDANIQAVAATAAADPMSAVNLGRWGVPRHLREDIQDSSVTSTQQALALARAKLSELQQASVQVELSALPIPHLEPEDRVVVDGGTWTWPTTIQKMSLPLDGQAMTIGRHVVTRTIRRR